MFVTKALSKRMIGSVAQTIDQIIWKMFGLSLSVLYKFALSPYCFSLSTPVEGLLLVNFSSQQPQIFLAGI